MKGEIFSLGAPLVFMSQMVPRLGGELSSLPSTAFRSPIRDVPDITPPSDHQLNQPIHRVFVDRMANEVRQVIWNGSIPLRIVLESSESRSKEEVEYYVGSFLFRRLILFQL